MKKILFSLALSALLFSCSESQENQNNDAQLIELSAVDFQSKIKEINNPQLVDVRTAEEFAGGHIENAKNIDWNGDNFNKEIQKLDKTQPVLVYCLSGGRSSAAVQEMQQLGFTNIIEMGGGMMDWRKNKLPETKNASTATKNIALTLDKYKELVNNSDKLVLVDFYAEWCGPCKRMEPYINKFAESEKEKLEIIRIDADEYADLCTQLNVTALPTMKLYKNNAIVWENVGFVSEADLLKVFQMNY
ncbi:MAG: thioredoxin domain-containing protein [Crocinitomicaceae bacterium]|jgi:thioredoxin